MTTEGVGGMPGEMPVLGQPQLPVPRPPGPVEAWQARPYPQLLRGPTFRWWRPLLSVAVGVAAVFALIVAVAVAGALNGDSGTSGGTSDADWTATPFGLLVTNLSLAAFIPMVMVATWAGFGWRPRWVASVAPGIRWRWLLACYAVILPVNGLLTGGLSVLGGQRWTPERQWPLLLLVVLLTTPLQAAGEEYVFRGWIPQLVGSAVPNAAVGALVGGAASNALFAFAHGQQDVWLFADRFGFGVLASWLVWRTGGLEAGIALHGVNNIVALGLTIAFGGLKDTLDASQATPALLVFDGLTLMLSLAPALWVSRRMRLARLFVPPPWQPPVAPAWYPPPGGYPPPVPHRWVSAGRCVAGAGAAAGLVVSGPVRGLLVDVDDTLVDTRAAMREGVLAAVLRFVPDLDAEGRATAVAVWLADPAGAFTAYRRGELTFGEQRRVRAERLHAALGGPLLDGGALAEWEAVYDAVFRGSWQLLPDAVAMLAVVRGLGLPCGVVTNAPRAYQEDKLRALDLADLPVLVATDDLGVGKPEPAVFRLGCERLGLPPGAVAYVGDELDVDARGARDAGLRGVWLDRHGSGLRPDDVPTVADLTELPAVLGLPASRR